MKKFLNIIKKYKINLICLAGYMKILSKKFIYSYKKKNYKYSSIITTKIQGT